MVTKRLTPDEVKALLSARKAAAAAAAAAVPAPVPAAPVTPPDLAGVLAALKAAGYKVEAPVTKTAAPVTLEQGAYAGHPIITLKNGGAPFSFGVAKARLLVALFDRPEWIKAVRALAAK